MRFFHLVLFLLVISCFHEEEFKPVYEVPEEFQAFVDSFVIEAKSRGFAFEMNNLIIKYDKDIDMLLCGKCNSNSLEVSIQKVISINPKQCWDNPYALEALVFHELGHCFLGRLHNHEVLPNGDPKSLMIPDNISVYSPCIYNIDGDNACDKTFKRTYYLDELFNENTPVPDWAD